MPTSSQNQVLANLTGKKKTKGRVLQQTRIEPVDDVENVWYEIDPPGIETAVSHQDRDTEEGSEVTGDHDERLHKLGFWNVGQNKEKIGVKTAEEQQAMSEEEMKQYTQSIMEEVEKKISEPPKKKVKDPPEEKPSAICFDFMANTITHKDVLEKISGLLHFYRGSKIVTIQFIPKTRWIINLDSREARDRLSGMEICFHKTVVQLRRYDDIMRLEYRKYLRANGLLELVTNSK